MNGEMPNPGDVDPESWRAVGGYLRESLVEVSNELGGQELTEQMIDMADSQSVLPDAQALAYLEQLYPGAAQEIITRAEQNQEIRLERGRESFISRLFRR